MKKIITGVLIGAMTLSMAGMAFADQVKTMDKTKLNRIGVTKEQREEKINEVFNQAVQKQIISQDQMDKLLEDSFINLTPEERKAKLEEKLAEAVKSGKMTQEQADKILEQREKGEKRFDKGDKVKLGNREDMKDLTPEERKAKMEERIKEVVESGKMTQEQADKFSEQRENGEKRFDKGNRIKLGNREDMKDLTPEERKAKMEERIKEGVESGKMTQEQADKFLEKMKNEDGFIMRRLSPVGGILKRGVEEGTITQAQMDDIIEIEKENRGK